MYTLKLISEHIEQDTDYLIESKEDGSKSYKIKGIFMQADVKNRNGRVYPMEVLNKEVKRYNKEYINEKRAFGELGHLQQVFAFCRVHLHLFVLHHQKLLWL